MPTITRPLASRAVAVQVSQPLRLEADAPTNWWKRNQSASENWVQLNGGGGGPVATLFWEAPATITRRLTFDRVQVVAADTEPGGGETGGLHLNVCEGPVAVLWATAHAGHEALQEPPLRPWDDEADDPPLGLPLVMPAANRDGLATCPLESAAGAGGPANLVALYGPGLFVDTAGRLGCRTAFTNDVRGLGPFPPIAAYHHGGLYLSPDPFGRSRTLGLTRFLYVDEDEHVAVVRGDGRRNTYRWTGSGYEPAAGLQSTLTLGGGVFEETTPGGKRFLYEASTGHLERVLDRVGNPVYYLYDDASRLRRIEGPPGRLGLVPYLTYDAEGLLERLVLEDPLAPENNRVSYFEYDLGRNLTTVVGPELCETSFEYAAGGGALMTRTTDAENFSWRTGYDGDGRVERVVDALTPGRAAYFEHDPSAAETTWVDRAGRVTYFQFGAWGSPERVWNPGAPADYHAFDDPQGHGNLVASENRLGRGWVYEYDARGNRQAVTDPLGAEQYFAHDAQDLLRTYVDPLGRATYLDYDGDRNRTAWVDPLGHTAYYDHEPTGLLSAKVDRRGAVTYFGWDARGNLAWVRDPLGHETAFAHDAAGGRTAQVDPLGRVSYLEYDLRGRVTRRIDPRGAETSLAYDARCNLVSETDALLRSTLHEYDGNSSRVRTEDALGESTYFGWDPEERLASQEDALGRVTTWGYDALGRRDRQTDALGRSSYFFHDDAHQRVRQEDARGRSSYFQYDEVGRLSHQEDALGATVYFGFDLAGQRVLSVDARGNPVYFEHDPRGLLVQTETAIGAVTGSVYDEEGRRIEQRGPRPEEVTYFTYDLAGRLTHTQDALGGVRATEHDAAGQVVAQVDELGSTTYFGHDLLGRQASSRDPAGLTTYHAYDAVGNVVLTNLDQGYGRQPFGSSPYGGQRATTYHTYDALNRRQTTADPHGHVSRVVYDRVGNVVESVNAREVATYFEVDALNRRVRTIDGVHHAATFTGYDEVGDVVLQVDPRGAATYLEYDAVHRLVFSEDPAGLLTYHQYDAAGNRTATRAVLGQGGAERWTYHEYDRVNRAFRQVAADGGETSYGFDVAGNQVLVVDPEGRPTYFEHDALGRQVARRNAFDHTWVTVYDARSSAVRQVDPEGRPAYMAYDGARRLASQWNALGERSYFLHDARGSRTVVKNPRGFKTRLRYDLLGRQTHRIDALGGVSYMGYDEVGNRVLSVDELGHPTYFAFDGLDRLSTVTDALGGVTYMGYDARSSVVLRVDADGRATYMAYDDARRLERTWFANPVVGETADPPTYFSYDPAGNLLTSDDTAAGLGVSTFEYDAMDRLKTKVTVAGPVYYEYDLSGKKTVFKDADLATNEYEYDEAGRLVEEVLDGSRTVAFEHDRSGLLTTRVLPGNRVIAYYAYDLAGRVKVLDNVAPGLGSIAYFAYQRNELGKPTWVRHEGGEDSYYEYDALDRLTLEEREDSSSTMYGFRYAYDQRGNRTNKSVFSSPASEVYYEHDARNLVTKEHVISGDTSYYAYDLAQRMTSLKVTGSGQSAYFTHDQRGQATQIEFAKASSPDATRTFAYNGRGERVFVDDGEATYWQHDGDKLVLERLADGTPRRRYRRNRSASNCASDMVEVVLPSGLRVYQASDPFGTPRRIVEGLEGVPGGTCLEDAFGNTLINVNSMEGLAGVRARWQGAAISRLNTVNTELYAPAAGLTYVSGPGLITLGTLGGSMPAQTRPLVVRGPDEDWFWCMVPPDDDCEPGSPEVIINEQPIGGLQGRVSSPANFYDSLLGGRTIGWRSVYSSIPLNAVGPVPGSFTTQYPACGYLFFVEFPHRDSGFPKNPRSPIVNACATCKCELRVDEYYERRGRSVGQDAWVRWGPWVPHVEIFGGQWADTEGRGHGGTSIMFDTGRGLRSGAGLPHVITSADVPNVRRGLATIPPYFVAQPGEVFEETLSLMQVWKLYNKDTGIPKATLRVRLELYSQWALGENDMRACELQSVGIQ